MLMSEISSFVRVTRASPCCCLQIKIKLFVCSLGRARKPDGRFS